MAENGIAHAMEVEQRGDKVTVTVFCNSAQDAATVYEKLDEQARAGVIIIALDAKAKA